MKLKYRDGPEKDLDNPWLMLSDEGSYVFLGADHNTSAYNGIAFFDPETLQLTKLLHDLVPPSPARIATVGTDRIRREGDGWSQEFFFTAQMVCCRLEGAAALLFDVRQMYDRERWGREHRFTEIGEEGIHGYRVRAKEQEFVVLSTAPLTRQDGWQEQRLAFDERRGEEPSWWAYHGLDVRGEARIVFAPADRLALAKQLLTDDGTWEEGETDPGRDVVLTQAISGLRGLLVHEGQFSPAILAGLPWFFQVWTRDEAIATGGLLALKEYALTAKILLRQITDILDDGRTPNRFPASEIGAADGVGWSFLRLHQVWLRRKDALTEERWRHVLEALLDSLAKLPWRDGLVWSRPQETWMDTTGPYHDDRAGACIEIQALTFRMLRLATDLAHAFMPEQTETLRAQASDLRGRVRTRFIHPTSHVIADRLSPEGMDWTARPNALLSCYIASDLFDRDEWARAVDAMLPELFSDWGALATISRKHPLFHGEHSGSDDASYHRGDTWYFVNNLCACALIMIDEKHARTAERILQASADDLLWHGAAGHASEISSAEHQESFGCPSQAWSLSSLIELHTRLKQLLPSAKNTH